MRLLPLMLLLACQPDPKDSVAAEPTCESPGPRDDSLHLNDVQAMGTHNSYHQEPEHVLDASWAYSHEPLDIQLEDQGVRQFELDIHLDVDLGWQVFHVPGADDLTSCLQLEDCLGLVKAWSDEHICHMPLMIWLEPKDDIDEVYDNLLPLDGHWDSLEASISAVWPADRVLTPDDVRGDAATLPEALAEHGWPTLAELRGKVFFSMLDTSEHRADYIGDATSLEDRLLFVLADDASEDFAATMKMDDPESQGADIAAAVAAGFMVGCNAGSADADDEENAASWEAGLASGCHYISTDKPPPVDGDASWYSEIPDGEPARCNPVWQSGDCEPGDIESL